MNKPFSLAEYKKDPSRLQLKFGNIAESALVFRDHIAVRTYDGTTVLISPTEWSKHFELSPKYEVRRARPYYNFGDKRNIQIWTYLTNAPLNTLWAGPEFGYHVEI